MQCKANALNLSFNKQHSIACAQLPHKLAKENRCFWDCLMLVENLVSANEWYGIQRCIWYHNICISLYISLWFSVCTKLIWWYTMDTDGFWRVSIDHNESIMHHHSPSFTIPHQYSPTVTLLTDLTVRNSFLHTYLISIYLGLCLLLCICSIQTVMLQWLTKILQKRSLHARLVAPWHYCSLLKWIPK